MKSFKEFYLNKYPVINEALHHELQRILKTSPAEDLYDNFRDAAAHLQKMGAETGLSGDIFDPNSGSSRAVFHHSEPHKIILDNKLTHIPVVSKIAYPGDLDQPGLRKQDEPLLGQMQNQNESHKMFEPYYTMTPVRNPDGSHKMTDGIKHYQTNPNGVIPTIFESHPKGHHLLIQKAHLYGPEHRNGDPEEHFFDHHGIDDYSIQRVLTHHYDRARGKIHLVSSSPSPEVENHPLFQKLLPLVLRGVHPNDLSVDAHNLGYVKHPHTGQHTAVGLDIGFMQPTLTAVAEGHVEPHNTFEHYDIRRKRRRR